MHEIAGHLSGLPGPRAAQHGLLLRWPAVGAVVRASALIDTAHAVVMVVLAVRGGPHRVATTVSALMAGTAAAVAWWSRPYGAGRGAMSAGPAAAGVRPG